MDADDGGDWVWRHGADCRLLADKFGRRSSMITITTLIILFALFVFPPLLGSGSPALVMAYLLIGLSLMGLTFGPMGALLPELFPTEVRYTGASFSYNVSSILGASVAPYIATGCRQIMACSTWACIWRPWRH